ncbi:phage tail protein, partial [Clostridium ihumii]|uniref:phage tail protein n=1 Tax=Clostridium ihumii TaxID=1470356 RepID=UPI00139238B1
MAQQFYTLLTNVGKAKLANASIYGRKINLTTLVVGDSNGNYYNPTESQEELVHEVWRGNIHLIAIDEQNPNWIKIETVIPSDVGGFTIREVGALDDEGNLILIAKYPETYKPVIDDGATKELKIRTILEVSNAENVTLKIKSNLITATMEDIDNLNKKIENIKVPVESVNSKTGAIELKAEDINCNDNKSVESHLEDMTK